MLAYLFFHRPTPEADVREYEEGLRRFHRALAGAGVSGFAGSWTYRVGDGYSDWYLIESSAVLDVINDAAVSGQRAGAHDMVARQATGGTGKLLTLVSGSYDADAGFEIGFSKPPGTTYPDLYSQLQIWTARPDVSLWRRMMVLGPPPEFTLLARAELELSPELEPSVFQRERI